MRRLAVQSRNDIYSTRRDYQELHERISQKLSFKAKSRSHEEIVFRPVPAGEVATQFTGFGGYIYPASDCDVTVVLATRTQSGTATFHLSKKVWNRFGHCISFQAGSNTRISLRVSPPVQFSIWGLDGGPVRLPPSVSEQKVTPSDLNVNSLTPETLYYQHTDVMTLELDEDSSDRLLLAQGVPIQLKKCSYCGRFLPVDPERLGALAFHKHNAKRTNHQNECRACKKWKINDSFNPLRTPDQFNESSLIARERSLFLREPQIVREIKERTGAGLKSQVWKRFGKKCFYCGKPLALRDVQLDHTRPFAYLWPIDIHATCLCAEHNNLKKDKFPVDFYSTEQLKKLSSICGLSLKKLAKKEVNPRELKRVTADIVTFAKSWDPRTFFAVARKVREIMPDCDLFNILRAKDADVASELAERLKERPPSVDQADPEEDESLFELEE